MFIGYPKLRERKESGRNLSRALKITTSGLEALMRCQWSRRKRRSLEPNMYCPLDPNREMHIIKTNSISLIQISNWMSINLLSMTARTNRTLMPQSSRTITRYRFGTSTPSFKATTTSTCRVQFPVSNCSCYSWGTNCSWIRFMAKKAICLPIRTKWKTLAAPIDRSS